MLINFLDLLLYVSIVFNFRAFDQQVFSRQKRNVNDELIWTNFQTLDDINDWFESLTSRFPNTIQTITTGETYEGRNITGIRITRGGRGTFVLEGGSLGADWLSPVTLTYIADRLIFGPDDETRRLTQDFDWYIFPVTNPDGYQYSQDRVSTIYKKKVK